MSKDLYPHARLDSTDRTILREEFVDFGDMWNTTTHLIKNSWKPFLWKTLVAKLLLIIAGLIGSVILLAPTIQGVWQNLELEYEGITYTLNEYPDLLDSIENEETFDFDNVTFNTDQLETFLDQNSTQVSISVMLTGVIFLAVIIVAFLIDIRTVMMYLNKKVMNVLSFDKRTLASLLKIAVVMIVFGFFAGIAQSIFAAITTNSFLISFLEQFVKFIFYSFFGLFSFFIILDGAGIIESLQAAFRRINEVYWKNVLRWLIYQVVYIAAFIILGTVSFLLFITLSLFASSGSILSTLLAILPVLIIGTVGMLFIEMFFMAFNTVSYYNIRHITEEE